jgi:hypothetical protein
MTANMLSDSLYSNAPCIWGEILSRDYLTAIKDSALILTEQKINKFCIIYNRKENTSTYTIGDKEKLNLLNDRINLVKMDNLRQDLQIKQCISYQNDTRLWVLMGGILTITFVVLFY